MALAYMGLKPATSAGKALPDSADPTWLDRESPPTVPITSSDHDSGNHGSGNHDSAARSDVSCPTLAHLRIGHDQMLFLHHARVQSYCGGGSFDTGQPMRPSRQGNPLL